MKKMRWEMLLNYKDFSIHDDSNDYKFDIYRTPFQIDYDRIIFSEDFRRLDKKTQVHPLKLNDHVHARMSHSLETSCVGRSLGSSLGEFLIKSNDFHPYKEDIDDKKQSDLLMPNLIGQILKASCLAHDIGNPPFGHKGEEHISSWFKERIDSHYFESLPQEEKDDLLHFEGNAQAFRILTRTSMRNNQGGMKLTYAVLASMMKYPWVYSNKLNETIKKIKFSCFRSEKEYLKKIAEKCGLMPSDTSIDGYSFKRHPLAYLSEASDDKCYNIMDLEDAFELNILDFETVFDVFAEFCSADKDFDRSKYTEKNKNTLSHLRAKAIHQCIKSVIKEFTDRYDDIMNGSVEVGYSLAKNCSLNSTLNKAIEIARSQVFTSERKAMLENQAKLIMNKLLENFIPIAYAITKDEEKTLSLHQQQLLHMMGSNVPLKTNDLYTNYRIVLDYISGMTDNYALRISEVIDQIK